MLFGGVAGFGIAITDWAAAELLTLPFSILGVPVNPQGRGDYFLAEDARDPKPA